MKYYKLCYQTGSIYIKTTLNMCNYDTHKEFLRELVNRNELNKIYVSDIMHICEIDETIYYENN